MADLLSLGVLFGCLLACGLAVALFDVLRSEVRDMDAEAIAMWVECPWPIAETAARKRGVGMAAPSDGFTKHKTSSFFGASSDGRK